MKVPATILVPLLSQRDDWLEECVRSALCQTVGCEVLVVIAPHTPERNLRTLARLRADVIMQKRPGFAAALNSGIRASTAPRVGFLLSDDWLERAAVERCLAEEADIVCTQHTIYAADGRAPVGSGRQILTRTEYESKRDLEERAAYLEHFFLFRKSKLEEVGGLDETLGDSPGIDDYDLIWTLLEHHATVCIVEQSLYNYRDHTDERLTLRGSRQMAETMGRILAKHGITGPRREALLRTKAAWFGRPIHAVLAARGGAGEM